MDETVVQSLVYSRYRKRIWLKKGRKDYRNYKQEEETKLKHLDMNKRICSTFAKVELTHKGSHAWFV